MPLRAPVYSTRNFRRFGLTPCAATLSVEGSRLARRPPRKRRAAAFTPRSETTIGTGLNSSGRDDIQTMDRHVFRVVVLRRNGTENRVKMCRTVAGKNNIFGSAFGGRCDTSSQINAPFWWTRVKLRQCTYGAAREFRSSLCGNNPHVRYVRAHVHPIRAEKMQLRAGNCRANVRGTRTSIDARKMHVQETCAARNKRNRKQNGTPDSKPVCRWQNDRRRILDRRGQAALLRVRPGAFLFDLARLYTPA